MKDDNDALKRKGPSEDMMIWHAWHKSTMGMGLLMDHYTKIGNTSVTNVDEWKACYVGEKKDDVMVMWG